MHDMKESPRRRHLDNWWFEKTLFLGFTKNELANLVVFVVALGFLVFVVNFMGVDKILGIR
ncbi:hypothetical protein KGQ25_01530 [Patescibacteria group bacterium]|nr:hypothetical protein [Patescibacteria group bacterium]